MAGMETSFATKHNPLNLNPDKTPLRRFLRVPGGGEESPAHLRDARELVVTCSRSCSASSALCLAAASPACPARSSSFSRRQFLSSACEERAKIRVKHPQSPGR